jgi:uncharacterized membrane protein YfhO
MPLRDSSATIKLDKNDNDVLSYSFNATTDQFAVFSEVYYDRGWKAFIDGKEAPIVKTNYVLRGLYVPAGSHKIEFRFEPQSYIMGSRITSISQIILVAVFLIALYMEFRRRKQAAAL